MELPDEIGRKDQEIEFHEKEEKNTDEMRVAMKRQEQEVEELRAKVRDRKINFASRSAELLAF